MDHIHDNIYLGSWRDCYNITHLGNRHSWKIISVANDAQVVGDYHFPITDGGTKDTDERYLREAIDTLLIHHKAGIQNVLVHCQSGVNRAPSVVIAAIIKILNLSYLDAFNFVKSKRNHIWPCYQQALNICKITEITPPDESWKGEKPLLTQAEDEVNHQYKKYLKRRADPDGLKYYSEQLATGRIDKHKLGKILKSSDEYKRKNSV